MSDLSYEKTVDTPFHGFSQPNLLTQSLKELEKQFQFFSERYGAQPDDWPRGAKASLLPFFEWCAHVINEQLEDGASCSGAGSESL